MPRWFGAALFAAMVLLFLIANRGAYQGYFSSDDLDNLALTRISQPAEFAIDLVRPHIRELDVRAAGFLYYSALGRIAGLRFGWYVAALHALHLLSVWLLWLLLRRLGFAPLHAAAGALLFAFHVALFDNWWKPMYIFDVLCGLFCLLSLLLYVRGKWVLSLLAFWLAYRSKEPALMLPAVLCCYEFLLGKKRWQRLVPFLLISAFFGMRGILLSPHQPDSTYRFSLAAADLWKTTAFYSSQLLFVPYLGLALAATLLFIRDRRFYLGAAAFVLLLVPVLVLPGRLFSAYLYAPMIGGAICFAVLATRLRAAWIALFFVLWLPWNYAQLRIKRRAELAVADGIRAYAAGLAGTARSLPQTRVFVYDQVPEGMYPWGIAGALCWHYRAPVELHQVEEEQIEKEIAGKNMALLNWDLYSRRITVLAHTVGEQPATYIRIQPLTPIWQLTEGWLPRDNIIRWTRPRARAQLWRPREARSFELRALISPLVLEQTGKVRVRLSIDGKAAGSHEYVQSGWQTVRWELPAAPAGAVEVEFQVEPVYEPGKSDLGIAIGAFGFIIPGTMQRDFDHVGIPTAEKHPGELWVGATRVWVTDPARDPHRIEFLRFEPDSPVQGPVRTMPHFAYRVDDLEKAMGDAEVLLGPFQATPALRVVFVLRDGAVFEYMQSDVPGHWFPAQ